MAFEGVEGCGLLASHFCSLSFLKDYAEKGASWSGILIPESIARKEQVFSLEENLRPEKAIMSLDQ